MAIKVIVDKLEDVEEPYRGLYTESEGKFMLSGVENLLEHPSVKKLQTENGGRRIENKKLSDALKKFEPLGDRDVNEVLATLDRVAELEVAAGGKIDEKKLGEMVEGRLKTKMGPIERELTKLKTDLVERDTQITAFKTKETTRTIHDAVREAVGKAQGFNATAMEDVLMFAERHLAVDENGKVTTKNEVGVTPGVDAVVWLSEMQQRKPHWWGPSGGGGAGGNRGAGGGGTNNPWRAETWNLTEQGKIVKENRTRADQLAQSAGTTVGGKKPQPKK